MLFDGCRSKRQIVLEKAKRASWLPLSMYTLFVTSVDIRRQLIDVTCRRTCLRVDLINGKYCSVTFRCILRSVGTDLTVVVITGEIQHLA